LHKSIGKYLKGGEKMEKKISEMTEKEILRQQLELLAKESQNCAEELLPHLSVAMCQIYDLIK